MNFKRWKLGICVSIALSVLVAGSGLAAGMKWQAFVSVLCTALLTHLGAFLTQNPVEKITFDTATITKTTVTPDSSQTVTLETRIPSAIQPVDATQPKV